MNQQNTFTFTKTTNKPIISYGMKNNYNVPNVFSTLYCSFEKNYIPYQDVEKINKLFEEIKKSNGDNTTTCVLFTHNAIMDARMKMLPENTIIIHMENICPIEYLSLFDKGNDNNFMKIFAKHLIINWLYTNFNYMNTKCIYCDYDVNLKVPKYSSSIPLENWFVSEEIWNKVEKYKIVNNNFDQFYAFKSNMPVDAKIFHRDKYINLMGLYFTDKTVPKQIKQVNMAEVFSAAFTISNSNKGPTKEENEKLDKIFSNSYKLANVKNFRELYEHVNDIVILYAKLYSFYLCLGLITTSEQVLKNCIYVNISFNKIPFGLLENFNEKVTSVK